nr:MAG TPA: Plasmid maintenance system killer protein [Caudoviricetes sp.]
MTTTDDLKLPSLRFHQLQGDKQNLYSITVQANWRLTFEFDNENVYILDYTDYH